MEILQTIWTALTTPNADLVYIILMPLIFVEAALTLLLSMSFLNLNISRKNFVLYVLIIPIVSILSNSFLSSDLRVVINLLFTPLFAVLVLKQNLLKGILIEILPILIILISETIWAKVFDIIFHITTSQIEVVPLYRFAISCLDYILLFIMYYLSKRFSFNINLLDDINKKNKTILIINSVIGVIAIITQLYLVCFYSNTLPLFITLVGLLSILAYFFISMYSLSNTTKLALATTDLEKEKEHNKTLKLLHDELRAFRHDFGNIMTTIGGYAHTSDIEGLRKYYSQIQIDLNRVNNLSTLSPDVINNPAIYSLLASKYHKADELGIKINLDVFLNLNSLNMKIYEFTRILGILMDNAIEATCECEEKIINLEIRKDISSPRQLLIIENTYKNKDINIDKIFEKNYSTKPKNSGLGLWEIRQILHKNNNLNLYTTKNDEFFKQQLEIYL